jgi:WD40 repeat protein
LIPVSNSTSPRAWKTVRVFISSTFKDMHAERDHLVRFVFPELRERCAMRQLHLVDVDLRWGVTEEEAEQKILEICLDEIERCRPFFIGILGERYGWVPPKYKVPDEKHYDWVRQFEPGHSITAMEIYHGVLHNPDIKMRSFFYFRDPAFLANVPEEHKATFLPENKESEEKLKRLKYDIRKNCPVFDYSCTFGGFSEDGKVMLTNLETFGMQVLEDLWSSIDLENPVEEKPPEELSMERAYHEAFIERRCLRFIGRRDLLEQMTAYTDSENNVPLVITGAPGCGKSALLANFAKAYAIKHSDVFVLPHFIGVSPGSTDIRRTLLRLCRELAQRFGIADEISEDNEKLLGMFQKFLEQAASQGKVLLILDALNQLDESYNAHTLNWLPYKLPKNLRVILSTLEGDCLEALRCRRPAPLEITMGPLESEDKKQIIRQTLWDYRKRLDERPKNDQMGLLLCKSESDNPLYIIVACEELRVFGEFEKVTERIASLPEDIPMLFEQVLDRLEHDHEKELVKSSLSLLACARHGLLETEMLELLRRDGEDQLPREIWARLYRSLQFYLRPTGEMGEDALDFFHRQLAKAVRQRYLRHEKEEISRHQGLAVYFKRKADPMGDAMWKGNYPRGLSEVPYHQARAGMSELAVTLIDFNFMEAKISALGTYPLIEDYDLAFIHGLKVSAEREKGVEKSLRLIQGALRLSSHVLAQDKTQLPSQLMGRLMALEVPEIHALLEQIKNCKDTPWLRPLTPSLTYPGGHLLRTLEGHTYYVNGVAVTRDGKAVSASWDKTLKVWDINSGELLRTLEGHKEVIYNVAVAPDGKVVSTSLDKTLKVWNINSGELLLTFEGLTCSLCVAVTSDGKIVSASINSTTYNGKILVLDINSGKILRTLEGHSSDVKGLAVTTDGKVVSASSDHTLKVWDISSGKLIHTLESHKDLVCGVAVTLDGKAISASADGTLKVWDISTGELIRTLEGHINRVENVAVTLDGRAISASDDHTLKVWDINSGDLLITLEGHTSQVWGVAVTSDGKVVSASIDKTLKVWDIDSKKILTTLEGHTQKVTSLALTPDGQVISTSWDNTLKVWDISSGKLFRTLKGHTASVEDVAVASNGRIVSASTDHTLRVWEIKSGKLLHILKGHGFQIYGVAMSLDGKIVSASYDETLKVWDINSGELLRTLEGHSGEVLNLKVISKGMVVSAYSDHTLKVWDINSGKLLRTLEGHSGNVMHVAMVEEDRVVSASLDNTLKVWDINSGKLLRTLGGHTDSVRNVAMISSGRVISASDDRTLMVWDINSGKLLRTLTRHTDSVEEIAVISGGRIVSASDDNSVKVWDTETGRIIATFIGDARMVCVVVSLEGPTIIAGDAGGHVHFLCLENIVPGTMGDAPLISSNPDNNKTWEKESHLMDSYEQNNNLKISESARDQSRDSVKKTPKFVDKENLENFRSSDTMANNESTRAMVENTTKVKNPWWKFWK